MTTFRDLLQMSSKEGLLAELESSEYLVSGDTSRDRLHLRSGKILCGRDDVANHHSVSLSRLKDPKNRCRKCFAALFTTRASSASFLGGGVDLLTMLGWTMRRRDFVAEQKARTTPNFTLWVAGRSTALDELAALFPADLWRTHSPRTHAFLASALETEVKTWEEILGGRAAREELRLRSSHLSREGTRLVVWPLPPERLQNYRSLSTTSVLALWAYGLRGDAEHSWLHLPTSVAYLLVSLGDLPHWLSPQDAPAVEDPRVLSTALGLWDRASKGPMASLENAVEAAYRILA